MSNPTMIKKLLFHKVQGCNNPNNLRMIADIGQINLRDCLYCQIVTRPHLANLTETSFRLRGRPVGVLAVIGAACWWKSPFERKLSLDAIS